MSRIGNLLGRFLGAGRFNAADYWDRRYREGGDSGDGSAGPHYQFKRDTINAVVARLGARSAVDFGCGDGRQIRELNIESYHGLDVSATVVQRCREQYRDRPGWRFDPVAEAALGRYDLALSIDVIYHVVAEDDYRRYVTALFSCAPHVLLYANFAPRPSASPHIVCRDNPAQIARLVPHAALVERIAHPSKQAFGFALYRVQS